MSVEYGDALRKRETSAPIYPPFDRIRPYPKRLVINVYGGYDVVNGKLICYTSPIQETLALSLQTALDALGCHWKTSLHKPEQGRENVAVQFEIRPLNDGSGYYELDIELYDDGIISLIASDLQGLERGVDTLVQIIQLDFEEYGGGTISTMWVRDWPD